MQWSPGTVKSANEKLGASSNSIGKRPRGCVPGMIRIDLTRQWLKSGPYRQEPRVRIRLPPAGSHAKPQYQRRTEQVDFGEALTEIAGVECKIHFFAMDLPHSDACKLSPRPSSNFESPSGGSPRSVPHEAARSQSPRLRSYARRCRR